VRFSLPGWTAADKLDPASSVKQADLIDKTETYLMLGYPFGHHGHRRVRVHDLGRLDDHAGKPGSRGVRREAFPPDIGLMEVLLSQAKFISTGVAGLTLWRHIGGR